MTDNYTKGTRGVRMQRTVCDKQVVTELTSDFSLPDYQPQIKRLLRVRATVCPADKYIGAGQAEFSGRVEYAILYAGNDGALYCTSESDEYRFSVPIEMSADIDLDDGFVCDVETLPDLTVGRVAAPRKLSVKCRLRSRVRLFATVCMEESISKEQTDLQRLCGQVEVARVFIGNGEPLSLADEILPEGDTGDLRVIEGSADVFISDTEAGSGIVNCRGEVALKLLVCHESAPSEPTLLTRRIPFSQAVPTPGVEVNCDSCADGVCTDLRITVEDARLLCEMGIVLRTRAQRNEGTSFTRDLYSTSSECTTRMQSMVQPTALRCVCGNFSLGTTLPCEEIGIKQGARVLDLSLTPSVTSLDCEKGKYYLNGHCRAHLILATEEDIGAQEFDLPFRYACDGSAAAPVDYDATVGIISCRARLDGERLAVDAELAVSLSTRGEVRFEMLTEAAFGDALERSSALCTVCYPSREDTLWSVAKRYCCAVETVSRTNDLALSPAADSPDSLAGVKYLLV